jgi:hypothetical protein
VFATAGGLKRAPSGPKPEAPPKKLKRSLRAVAAPTLVRLHARAADTAAAVAHPNVVLSASPCNAPRVVARARADG